MQEKQTTSKKYALLTFLACGGLVAKSQLRGRIDTGWRTQSSDLWYLCHYGSLAFKAQELKLGFNDELKFGFSDELKLGFSDELKLGFSDELKLGFSDELKFGFSDELKLGFSDELKLGFSDESS
ncbi:hypothetical protein AVEN_213486-1 [Araneus ventricosus]|uniref:Uncharacterized protein n=1 Tax=Araneus ventricosus TaxID=182803 RepID=A0A4Y2UBK9_ARAVE|nr:hypothetical protein AVEN_213486-1 [Araneus ventricosus]